MEKTKNHHRAVNGRYDFGDMELMCVCGHKLGCHSGDNDTRKRPCFNSDNGIGDGTPCSCKNFKKKINK